MFKILKTLKKMMSNMKDQMNNFSRDGTYREEWSESATNEKLVTENEYIWEAHLSIDSL